MKCLACGHDFSESACGFHLRNGFVCMRHEREQISTLEIEHGGVKEIHTDILEAMQSLENLMRDAEQGESYTITRGNMLVLEFFDLEEFQGF